MANPVRHSRVSSLPGPSDRVPGTIYILKPSDRDYATQFVAGVDGDLVQVIGDRIPDGASVGQLLALVEPGLLGWIDPPATEVSWSMVTGKPSFGTASTRDVGTSEGTVASGLDTRLDAAGKSLLVPDVSERGTSAYPLVASSRGAFRVDGWSGLKTGSGSCTFTTYKNGVAIPGLSGVSVTSSASAPDASSGNVFAQGDELSISFPTNAAALMFRGTLRCVPV